MVREDRAWRMKVASPTTTASSSQTGRKHGSWKRQESTGQQKESKVIGKKKFTLNIRLLWPIQGILWESRHPK